MKAIVIVLTSLFLTSLALAAPASGGMNVSFSAHFPIVQIAVAAAGLIAIIFGKPGWVQELGKAMLWAGLFAALFAASGSC